VVVLFFVDGGTDFIDEREKSIAKELLVNIDRSERYHAVRGQLLALDNRTNF